MRDRSMLRVIGSTSTNTGLPPARTITLAVATQDSGVVITSSPGPTPASDMAISMPPVAELNARTGRPAKYADSVASNSRTCGPLVIQPERSTSATPAMVASSIEGRVNGRNSLLTMAPLGVAAASAARHQPHAEDDDRDAAHTRRAELLGEQQPGSQCVHHVADREHGVGDADIDPRQRQDPEHHADRVAGQAAEDRPVQCDTLDQCGTVGETE